MRFPSLRPLLWRTGVIIGLAAVGCGPAETNATAYLTWQLVDSKAPDPNTAPALTCAQKSVSVIRVQLSPGSQMFDFPCASMAAETQTVPSGVYTIQTIALNATFQALAQLTFQQRLFGQTNLGHIIFQIP